MALNGIDHLMGSPNGIDLHRALNDQLQNERLLSEITMDEFSFIWRALVMLPVALDKVTPVEHSMGKVLN